jgi:penicillin-binding protein 2B
MYPSNNPRIIVYVSIQQPTWGGANAVIGATKEMITNITKYLNLFDDGTMKSKVQTYTLDSYKSKQTSKIVSELTEKNIAVTQIGNGDKIIGQYPASGSKLLSYDKVILITNDQVKTIPNLTGWSKKDAINILKLLSVNYEVEGSGYVIEQSIPVGTQITDNMSVKITLKDKYNVEEIG